MPTDVKMPKLGLTMEEGAIVEWRKAEGEAVEAGEALFVLETDKITYEVEAPQGGVLGQILVAPGTTVPTGTTVGLILAEGERLAVPAKRPEGETSSQQVRPRPKATPVARRMAEAAGLEIDAIEGTGTGGRVTTEDVQRALAHMEDGGPAASSLPAPADAPGTRLRPSSIKASPRAREMAAQAGLDLSKVEGTGPQGRIMVRDVERALAAAPAELVDVLPSPPAPPAGLPVAGQIIPLSGVRGVIARRMSESTRTAAAVTTTAQADATTLVGLRAALRQEWHALSGPAPSYNDLFVVILGKALAEFAYMNAHILDEQIHLMAEINIGLAVDTDRGLVVPVLRSVQGMSLAEVTRASADLVKRARGGKLLPDDLNGGTFTLSNLGAFDVDASTPIINLPECAVLGVGRIAPRPAVVDGALGVRQTVTLSLTYDHRAIDGAPAARFLQRVKQLVEQPGLAFVTRQGPAGGSPSSAGHVAG